MKRSISIQLKALFLLFVFASNMAVGLACAIGLDMSFPPWCKVDLPNQQALALGASFVVKVL